MSIPAITQIQDSTLTLPGRKGSNIRSAQRAEGDQVTLSPEALNVAAEDGIFGQKVRGKLGDDVVEFNNNTGEITWGGTRLNLKGFANGLKSDLVVEKKEDGRFRVMNFDNNTQLYLDSSGEQEKNAFGLPDITTDFVGPATNGALFIGNKQWGNSGTSYNDMIINRRAGAEIYASAGNDKIFNLNARVKSIQATTGENAVYSVGLKDKASIDMSEGDSGYLKLMGSAQGASITMGQQGVNVIDAKGKRLADTTINTQQSAALNIVATGNLQQSKVTLKGEETLLDAKQVQGSQIAFGSGSNTFTADGLKGDSRVSADSGSSNTFSLGAVTKADINLAAADDNALRLKKDAANAVISLGSGQNSLDAAKRTLYNTTITSAEPTEPDDAFDENGDLLPPAEVKPGQTAIAAGSIQGKDGNTARIALAGDGNRLDVSGNVRNAEVDLGTGANTFTAKNVSNTSLNAGGEDSEAEQTVSISGNASNFTYTGGMGKDTVSIQGAMSGGSVDLGDGDNSLTVARAIKETAISAQGEGATTLSAQSYKGKMGGDITLGDGGNTVNFRGRVHKADIELGAGANSFSTGPSGKGLEDVNLAATGSTAAQSVAIGSGARRFTYMGSDGEDALTIRGHVVDTDIDLGTGNNNFSAIRGNKGAELRGVSIDAGGTGSTTLSMGGIRNRLNQYTRISLGGGGNSVSIMGKVNGGTSIDLGTGANTFRSDSILGKSGREVNLTAGGPRSTMAQDVLINGKTEHFTYTGSAGEDNLRVRDKAVHSTFDLGYGDKSASVVPGKGTTVTAGGGPPPTTGDGGISIGGIGDGDGIAVGGLDDGIDDGIAVGGLADGIADGNTAGPLGPPVAELDTAVAVTDLMPPSAES